MDKKLELALEAINFLLDQVVGTNPNTGTKVNPTTQQALKTGKNIGAFPQQTPTVIKRPPIPVANNPINRKLALQRQIKTQAPNNIGQLNRTARSVRPATAPVADNPATRYALRNQQQQAPV